MPRFAAFFLILLLAVSAGCAGPRHSGRADVKQKDGISQPRRLFDFERDTLAFANELQWAYAPDGQGGMKHAKRDPKPDFTLRCFAMVRIAKQFHLHATFEPSLPQLGDAELEEHLKGILEKSPRFRFGGQDVVIPGYDGLKSLSRDKADFLKSACGGAWKSYLQRGNWRVVFPFSRSGQDGLSQDLLRDIRQGQVVAVHILKFPSTSINHALLIYEAKPEESGSIVFKAYDPNDPSKPVQLHWRAGLKSFWMEPTPYFLGGSVDAYPVFEGALY